jgi:hypothetical protein
MSTANNGVTARASRLADELRDPARKLAVEVHLSARNRLHQSAEAICRRTVEHDEQQHDGRTVGAACQALDLVGGDDANGAKAHGGAIARRRRIV